MNFTPTQQQNLLSKMGYDGPADSKMMEAFIASSPGAAAKMGKFSRAMQKRTGMASGGAITQSLAGGGEGEYPVWKYNGVTYTSKSQATKAKAAADAKASTTKPTTNKKTTDKKTTDKKTTNKKPTPKPASGKIVDIETAKTTLAELTDKLSKAIRRSEANPKNKALKDIVEDVRKEYQAAESRLNVAQTQNQISLPTGGETVGEIFTDPTSMVETATVKKIGPATPKELISTGTGKVNKVREADTSTVKKTATADGPEAMTATTYDATKSIDDVRDQAEGTEAATGEVSQLVTPQTMDTEDLGQLGLTAPQIEEIRQVLDTGDLKVTKDQLAEAATLANQGIPLPQAIAQTTGQPEEVIAAKFTTPTPDADAVVDYDVPPTESANLLATEIEDAAKAGEIPTAEEKVSTFESTVDAAQGKVGAEELVEAKDIVKVAETIEATAATMDALNEASVAQAVNGTLSQAALATAEQGSVPASATISGQIEILLEQFNDGTPAWAAGAMRAANAAMAARGLGASSMAGAAIVQASMEAAMPIAQADAEMFMKMELTNLDNRQQVALSNAAAQKDMELANLSNEQQVALQNSANAFALQSQNLSNSQAAVIANAQIKASLQGKVLDIYTQTSLANASRYAEINNINLNNEQQTLLTKSAQNLQVDLANLDSTQQTALANLQVRASIRGQELTNEQQMAMLESTQNFQAAEFNASAKQQAFIQDAAATLAMQGKVLDNKQQTELFNISNIVQERNLELTGEQQTRIFNATNRTNVDLANLSSRQQTALANAQIDAALRGQELTNAQQTGIVNAARIGEVANINFTADQQRAIENSKLAQSVDLANLNSRSAKLLSDAAAMTNLDMTNLNNRQQAQVQNAQNLLQMDLTNLNNEQQTSIFASQSIINSMLSDQAAENAAEQFNAASENQVTQFYADLEANIARFNADQSNAMAQFNAGEKNANERFNTQLESARDQFNASNGLIIAQANAKWRQTIALTDTEAQNEANREEAATANAMTAKALDDLWQRERDIMAFAFSSGENAADRNVDLLLGEKSLDSVQMQLDAQEDAGKTQMYLWATDKIFGGSWF